MSKISHKTNLFIEKSRKKHGDKYSYEKTIYEKAKVKVIITCEEHGDFIITPDGHLSGKGCLECSKLSRTNKRRNTKLDFIARGEETWGDKYCYELFEYKNSEIKGVIRCKEHNIEFEQTPTNHYKGKEGCQKCKKNKIRTNEEYIRDCQSRYKDKYCYDETKFTAMNKKIAIYCNNHGGLFTQNAYSHLNGSNCPICSGNYCDTEIFIEKAKISHGDRFDYSEVIYINSKNEIKIICPLHGSFYQLPTVHLRKDALHCPECVRDKMSKPKYSLDDFKKLAVEKHGKRYDYSLIVNYYNVRTSVPIRCYIHGVFSISAAAHLTGQGCIKCGYLSAAEKTKLSIEVIKERIGECHGDRYVYDFSNHISCHDKIDIDCKYHGKFRQSISKHMQGQGCPECARYKNFIFIINAPYEIKNDNKYLYFCYFECANGERFYKVGVSNYKAKESRYSASALNQDGLKLLSVDEVLTTAYKALLTETHILETYKEYALNKIQQMKKIGGGTECLNFNIINIKTLRDHESDAILNEDKYLEMVTKKSFSNYRDKLILSKI